MPDNPGTGIWIGKAPGGGSTPGRGIAIFTSANNANGVVLLGSGNDVFTTIYQDAHLEISTHPGREVRVTASTGWSGSARGTRTSGLFYAKRVRTDSLRVGSTMYDNMDSLVTIGSDTNKAGVHIHGGIRLEGGATDGNGQIAGIATAGAGDSVQVTISGALPTDVVVVSYIQGAGAAMPYTQVWVANTLTVFATNGQKIAYIRIRK